MRPSASVAASVAAFIQAIIKTLRVCTSCAITGTNPAASNLMAAICSGLARIDTASGMADSLRVAATGRPGEIGRT